MLEQDAAAEKTVSAIAKELEVCKAQMGGEYSSAMECVARPPQGAELDAQGFTYTARDMSRSGIQFVIAKLSGGGVTRTCSPPGAGRCGANGTW
jgi:hypothetical protein